MFAVPRLWYENIPKRRQYIVLFTLMAYVNLLNQLPQNGKDLFRKLEGSNNKLIKLKWSKTFNEVCLKEDILPNYTRNIYN